MNIKNTQDGSVRISGTVISEIAETAALEIEGVAGLSHGLSVVAGRVISPGIKIDMGVESAVIDISLVIYYGYLLPKVAKKVQMAVVGAVESMTGLKVSAVNIRVADILFERPAPPVTAE